jgi:L,D-transpeptidase catalytic domain
VSRGSTAGVACVLMLGAAGLGFANGPDPVKATRASARALATEPPGLFAGGPGPAAAAATRVARRTAQSARVQAVGGRVVAIARGGSVRLHSRPGGPAVGVLSGSTPFGSPQTLAVVRRKRGWLGVLTNALPNGAVGWIRDEPAVLAAARNEVRIVVDRSERRLDLLRGNRRVMSVAVGVGRPGSETPTGRFAVTDKLLGEWYTRSYGCCVLALSGRQPRLPRGWRGGDRLAIHGTDGRSAPAGGSAGCVAVDRRPLERLMHEVPLGTVVTITR